MAYNVEHRVEQSVRSLLDQHLPEGVRWDRIWVVASGCTDGTVEVVRDLAQQDPRLGVVVEPERRGKAAALGEVLARSTAPALVLLNSDAVAQPGAIDALLARSVGRRNPYAVMARPVLPRDAQGEWASTLQWMWDLHHEYHLELLADGRGAHLCDELLLLGGPRYPPLPTGVINDGSFLGVWLATHGGTCWYAPDARVEIEVPRRLPDHLRQRRRIHAGNAQVKSLLDASPTTLPRYFLRHPRSTLRQIARLAARQNGRRHLARVVAGEAISRGLAVWDRLPPARDHVCWTPVERPSRVTATPPRGTGVGSSARRDPPTGHRARALLEIAGRFGTGIPIEELVRLLPNSAPRDGPELERWLLAQPELAALIDGPARRGPGTDGERGDRRRRGVAYRAEAERLLSGPLGFARTWARCVAITGSTAYGEPNAGDDLDFFVVVRRGLVWLFLLRAYLALRLGSGRKGGSAAPPPCFNFVVDEAQARSEFNRVRDALVAREALAAIPISGGEYYRGLLAGAPWMAEPFPRLYAVRSERAGSTAAEPASAPARCANALVFPLLASYLQLVGLHRNWSDRRSAGRSGSFRTTTTPARLMFASARFDGLRESYRAMDHPCAPSYEGLDYAVGPATTWRGAYR